MLAPIVMLDTPSSTTAYDTTLPANGAPAPVGSVRYFQDPTSGFQAYRLVRASGAALTSGLVVAYTGASSEIAANASVAATARAKIAGVMQNAVADGYWGWALCAGKGTATAGIGGTAVGGSILNSAAGKVVADTGPGTPTATESLAVIGKALTAVAADASASVLIAGLL